MIFQNQEQITTVINLLKHYLCLIINHQLFRFLSFFYKKTLNLQWKLFVCSRCVRLFVGFVCLVGFFQLEQDILLHILQTFIQTNSAFIVTVYIGFPKKLLSLRSESNFLFTLGFVFLLCFVVRCGCITVPASQIL